MLKKHRLNLTPTTQQPPSPGFPGLTAPHVGTARRPMSLLDEPDDTPEEIASMARDEAKDKAIQDKIQGKEEYLLSCRPWFEGSEKEIKWAISIWEKAVWSIAVSWSLDEITKERACALVSNPSAKFWIDNRDNLDELK